MAYRSEIKIRFGDEDHAGIVYYPRFFDFFHRVFEDFFGDEIKSYHEVLDVDGFGWPAVHTETDFKAPLRFGDVMEVELSIERVGDKSATFRYVGTKKADGSEVVVARIVVACIDMKTFTGRTIPDEYRRLFENHLVR